MSSIEKPGPLMATRELELVDANGAHVRRVVVKLYKPRRMDDGEDWICNYRILGIGGEKLRYGAGVDAIQALLLALSIIGAELYTSTEARAGLLKWCDTGQLGFPIVFPELIGAHAGDIMKLFV